MPMVPQVAPNDSPTPDYQATPVQPMRNFAPEQMQQTGATLERAGAQTTRNAQEYQFRLQEQMDDANVKAAETKFIQSATNVLHGENGYMLKRGNDAITGYDAAAGDLSKAKQDASDGLANPVQKMMFNQVAQRHLVTLGGQMSAHRAQQRIEYSSQQSVDRADSMRSMAQNSEIGSADQNSYIEAGVKEVQNALSFKGVPADSEEAKQAERKFRSQITADNVSRLMEDGKYEDANKLLTEQQKAGYVEADTGDRLRRAIRGNLLRTQAIEQADEIFQKHQNDKLRGADLEAMLSDANKIENPEIRQHVQDLVRAKFNEYHTLQNEKYRDNLNDVVNQLAANGGNIRKVDPVQWGMLDAKDQADLMPKPKPAETDMNTWYGFITHPETLTLQAVNEAAAKGMLSKGDFKNFTEMAMRQSKDKSYVQEASDINGRINYFANLNGMNVYGMRNGKEDKQTPEDKAAHGALTMAVQNEIDRVKAQNHGKITSEQVDKIITSEVTQRTLSVQFPRSAWSPQRLFGSPTYTESVQKRGFEMPQGATHVVPGSDGKMHYTDGKNDLGVVQ